MPGRVTPYVYEVLPKCTVLIYDLATLWVRQGLANRIQKLLLLATPVAVKWTAASNLFARAYTQEYVMYKRLNRILLMAKSLIILYL